MGPAGDKARTAADRLPAPLLQLPHASWADLPEHPWFTFSAGSSQRSAMRPTSEPIFPELLLPKYSETFHRCSHLRLLIFHL